MTNSRGGFLLAILLLAAPSILFSKASGLLLKEDLDDVDTGERRELATTTAATGYWKTSGSDIVDSNGDKVYFSGLNWGGFDATNCIVDGLWPLGAVAGRTYTSHLAQMVTNGFNLIRLAFAGTCMQPNTYPVQTGFDTTTNADIAGMTTIEVMKTIVSAADGMGIKVILDYHRIVPAGTAGEPEAGLWYDSVYNASFWLDTWKYVATEFADVSGVVGVDLFNEPHNSRDVPPAFPGPFWNYNYSDPYNWLAAAKSAADVIQSVQPKWLICVQGMWNAPSWWGANLREVATYPLNLTVPHRLVYEVHDYGAIVNDQPWYHVAGYPATLTDFWNASWGYVHAEDIAPIWIGEFGSKLEPANASESAALEALWLPNLIAYIKTNHFSWTWFTWMNNSGDTGGILMDDLQTANPAKVALLRPIQYPSFSLQTSSNSTAATPPATLAPISSTGSPPPPKSASPPPSSSGTSIRHHPDFTSRLLWVCYSLGLLTPAVMLLSFRSV